MSVGTVRGKRKVANDGNAATKRPRRKVARYEAGDEGITGGELGAGDEGITGGGQSDDDVCRMISTFRSMLASHVAAHPECEEYAPAMSKYMRNQFVFMGLKAPARRSLQRTFLAGNGDGTQDRSTLIGFVRALWDQDERDFQGFGVDLLVQRRDVLLGETEQEFHEAMGVAKYCIVTKSWWDTVDTIAYQVVGHFVEQRASLGVPLMQEWIDDDHMWLRRTAILHQLSRKKDTNQELLFGLCLKRADETEFFIRKAIGWALREYTKTNKKAVKDFVEKNKGSLSALSSKEALKHC